MCRKCLEGLQLNQTRVMVSKKYKLVEAKDKSYIVMMQEGKWLHAVSVNQKQTPHFKHLGSRLYDHAIQKQATKEELVSMRQTLLGELMDLH